MIEPSLYRLIEALCADYERRARLIRSHILPTRCENELKYYNYKIYDAVCEIVDEGMAEDMIEDIGSGVGYAKTNMDYVSESTYKRYKHNTIYNIAMKLHLL